MSKLSGILPKFTNSIVPNGWLMKYPAEYQCHLERISDFLLPGEGVWWRRDLRGVEFFDGQDEVDYRPEGPFLHHFRFSNMKIEQDYLAESWRKCLSDETIIPHIVLTCRDEANNEDKEINTGFFDDGGDNDEDDLPTDPADNCGEESDDSNDDEVETEIGFSYEKHEVD